MFYLDSHTPTQTGWCVPQPECPSTAYLANYSALQKGECTPHPQCTASATYLAGANATRQGTCEPCANTVCPARTYRVGVCNSHPATQHHDSTPGSSNHTKAVQPAITTPLSTSSNLNNFTCRTCSNITCRNGMFRSGMCGGLLDGFLCEACQHWKCADHQIQTGQCTGITNSLACKNMTLPELLRTRACGDVVALEFGFPVQDLVRAGCTGCELKAAGIAIPALKSAPLLASNLRGCSDADELLANGYTFADLAQSGFDVQQLASYSPQVATPVSCDPGYYFNVKREGCWPCLGGTFAKTEDIRVGLDDSDRQACPGQCPLGYTSRAASTSKDACRLGYVPTEPLAGQTVGFCQGKAQSADVDGNSCPFENRGFQMVTTIEECRFAAQLIVNSTQDGADFRVATSNLNVMACPEFGGCAPTAAAGNSNATAAAVMNVAPLGYCGLEVDHSGFQRLVFYVDTAARALYSGARFVPICKVLECNHLEQIRGRGASQPMDVGESRLPVPSDQPECVPNDVQLSVWRQEEDDKYTQFYRPVMVVVLTILALGLAFELHHSYTKAHRSKDRREHPRAHIMVTTDNPMYMYDATSPKQRAGGGARPVNVAVNAPGPDYAVINDTEVYTDAEIAPFAPFASAESTVGMADIYGEESTTGVGADVLLGFGVYDNSHGEDIGAVNDIYSAQATDGQLGVYDNSGEQAIGHVADIYGGEPSTGNGDVLYDCFVRPERERQLGGDLLAKKLPSYGVFIGTKSFGSGAVGEHDATASVPGQAANVYGTDEEGLYLTGAQLFQAMQAQTATPDQFETEEKVLFGRQEFSDMAVSIYEEITRHGRTRKQTLAVVAQGAAEADTPSQLPFKEQQAAETSLAFVVPFDVNAITLEELLWYEEAVTDTLSQHINPSSLMCVQFRKHDAKDVAVVGINLDAGASADVQQNQMNGYIDTLNETIRLAALSIAVPVDNAVLVGRENIYETGEVATVACLITSSVHIPIILSDGVLQQVMEDTGSNEHEAGQLMIQTLKARNERLQVILNIEECSVYRAECTAALAVTEWQGAVNSSADNNTHGKTDEVTIASLPVDEVRVHEKMTKWGAEKLFRDLARGGGIKPGTFLVRRQAPGVALTLFTNGQKKKGAKTTGRLTEHHMLMEDLFGSYVMNDKDLRKQCATLEQVIEHLAATKDQVTVRLTAILQPTTPAGAASRERPQHGLLAAKMGELVLNNKRKGGFASNVRRGAANQAKALAQPNMCSGVDGPLGIHGNSREQAIGHVADIYGGEPSTGNGDVLYDCFVRPERERQLGGDLLAKKLPSYGVFIGTKSFGSGAVGEHDATASVPGQAANVYGTDEEGLYLTGAQLFQAMQAQTATPDQFETEEKVLFGRQEFSDMAVSIYEEITRHGRTRKQTLAVVAQGAAEADTPSQLPFKEQQAAETSLAFVVPFDVNAITLEELLWYEEAVTDTLSQHINPSSLMCVQFRKHDAKDVAVVGINLDAGASADVQQNQMNGYIDTLNETIRLAALSIAVPVDNAVLVGRENIYETGEVATVACLITSSVHIPIILSDGVLQQVMEDTGSNEHEAGQLMIQTLKARNERLQVILNIEECSVYRAECTAALAVTEWQGAVNSSADNNTHGKTDEVTIASLPVDEVRVHEKMTKWGAEKLFRDLARGGGIKPGTFLVRRQAPGVALTLFTNGQKKKGAKTTGRLTEHHMLMEDLFGSYVMNDKDLRKQCATLEQVIEHLAATKDQVTVRLTAILQPTTPAGAASRERPQHGLLAAKMGELVLNNKRKGGFASNVRRGAANQVKAKDVVTGNNAIDSDYYEAEPAPRVNPTRESDDNVYGAMELQPASSVRKYSRDPDSKGTTATNDARHRQSHDDSVYGEMDGSVWEPGAGKAVTMGSAVFSLAAAAKAVRTTNLWKLGMKSVGYFVLSIRVLDCTTDWGFLLISVSNRRFEYLMNQEGLDFESFRGCALVVCVVASILFLPDVLAFVSKRAALSKRTLPSLSAHRITVAVVVFEDLPQMCLAVAYLVINRNGNAKLCKEFQESVDPLAILSLIMSFLSVLLNLLTVFKEEWFFSFQDMNGNKAERSAFIPERWIVALKRAAVSIVNQSKAVHIDMGVKLEAVRCFHVEQGNTAEVQKVALAIKKLNNLPVDFFDKVVASVGSPADLDQMNSAEVYEPMASIELEVLDAKLNEAWKVLQEFEENYGDADGAPIYDTASQAPRHDFADQLRAERDNVYSLASSSQPPAADLCELEETDPDTNLPVYDHAAADNVSGTMEMHDLASANHPGASMPVYAQATADSVGGANNPDASMPVYDQATAENMSGVIEMHRIASTDNAAANMYDQAAADTVSDSGVPYIHTTDRAKAEVILRGGVPGTYLFRQPKEGGGIVLSVLVSGTVIEHHRVDVVNGSCQLNGNELGQPCVDFSALVAHLSSVRDVASAILTTGIGLEDVTHQSRTRASSFSGFGDDHKDFVEGIDLCGGFGDDQGGFVEGVDLYGDVGAEFEI